MCYGDDKSWLCGGVWSTIDDVSLVISAQTKDGVVFVSDSRESRHTSDGLICVDRGRKLFRLDEGAIMGLAGPAGLGRVLVRRIGSAPPSDACNIAYDFARSESNVPPFSILVGSASGSVFMLPYNNETWQRPTSLDRQYATIGRDIAALALLEVCWRDSLSLKEAAVLCCASMEISKVYAGVGGSVHVLASSDDESLVADVESTAPALAAEWTKRLADTDWVKRSVR